ncbi:MAG: hypothetical protein Q7S77_02120 [Candidatus Staskawiczbacteria bacterium]|nr:hypothetical protein [Candidatus Staskawiczbacteria bacterium]
MAKVDIDGEEFYLILHKTEYEYCADCLVKMSIRCAWCGKSIKIGDPVTLNTPTKKSFQIPSYAVRYGETYPIRLIGCLRWDCADSGADRAGFWVTPGKVYRVLSPMEMVMATGGCVIINDLTNPNQAIPHPDNSNHL